MKQIQKNDFIIGLLKGAVGEDVDVANFPVWEVIATSTVPLRGKGGTIFNKAVIQQHTLFQLASAINRESLPIMVDHDMSGAPKGKIFYAEVTTPNELGHVELRGYMYVDPTEQQIIAKIDNGTYDETSIAFQSDRMNCSACGFDYMEAIDKGNIIPAMLQTCENDHTIGIDGTHLLLNGVREAMELSLVSRGAAKNSKIVGQSNSKLGKEIERLAAHGLDVMNFIVTASAPEGIKHMDLSDLVIKLSDTKAELAVAKNDVERLERELAAARGAENEAKTKATQLESDLAEARTAAANAPSAEEREQATKDSKDAKASVEFLKGQYTAVLTAAGKKDFEVPEDVETLIEGIKEHKAELSAILPVDGVAQASGTENKSNATDFSTFKVVKNR